MSIFPLLQGIGRAICMFIVYTVYHEAFWANQSRVPASLLNAFNGHLTTPCLLNVSPSTLRPHALLPRPNCRGFDWPREVVSPNSCPGWQLGCISLRKGSQRIQIILDILVLLLDSLNGLVLGSFFCRFLGALHDLNRVRNAQEGRL